MKQSILWLLIPISVFFLTAAGGAQGDEVAHLLLGLTLILVGAKLGAELFERLSQPPVLGELAFGILAGNLTLFGFEGLEFVKENKVILALSEVGVILLLFEVGLESTVSEMLKVGKSAFIVAVLGVITPFFLGWGASALFFPNQSSLAHIFIGAMLCATSVGITARVLTDIGKIRSIEAQIILGAAVIDDILGLVILAVISGIITSASAGGSVQIVPIAFVILKSILFVGVGVFLGHLLVPYLFSAAKFLRTKGLLLTMSIALCFIFSWVAHAIGLAFIVGAFVAGLILEEAHFLQLVSPQSPQRQGEHAASLEALLHPIVSFLVPVFFVRTGMDLDLRAFGNPSVLGFAAVLTLAAILGKQICSLGVLEGGVNRLAVGLGMIPRGEVGLIFANIGAGLILANGQRVVDANTFGAAVIMVGVTTMVTPPLLKWIFLRS